MTESTITAADDPMLASWSRQLDRTGGPATVVLADGEDPRVQEAAGIDPAVLANLSLVEELKTGHLVKVEVEGLDLRRPLSGEGRGRCLPRPPCSSTSSRGMRPGDRRTDVLTQSAYSRCLAQKRSPVSRSNTST